MTYENVAVQRTTEGVYVWYDGVCGDYRGGGGWEARGPIQQCSYRRNWEARPEWEVCAVLLYVCAQVCVSMCKQRGRVDAFSGSLCYQLSPKLRDVPPPAWQVISCYGDKRVTNPPPPCRHKYACHTCVTHTYTFWVVETAVIWIAINCIVFCHCPTR